MSHFIKKWQREYLLNLLEAHRPKGANKEPSINVGDVVLLRNEQTKRSFWKLCRVVELLESKDGAVRAAKVQVGSCSGGKKVLRRALNFLVPLEIRNLNILKDMLKKWEGLIVNVSCVNM